MKIAKFLLLLQICAICQCEYDLDNDTTDSDETMEDTSEENSSSSEELNDISANSRIVGGYTTNVETYPFMAQLQIEDFRFCGGSIIAKDWILTAGHCTHPFTNATLTVRVGTSYNEEKGKTYKSSDVKLHNKYNDDTLDYDVGLVKLEKSLTFTPKIRKIPILHEDLSNKNNYKVIVLGWGLLVEKSQLGAMILQAVDISLIDYKTCANLHKDVGLTPRMICAGLVEGGKDACTTDSGGPLINSEHKQIGVVSWGIGCALPKRPGVYSRLSDPEIKSYINQHLETTSRRRTLHKLRHKKKKFGRTIKKIKHKH